MQSNKSLNRHFRLQTPEFRPQTSSFKSPDFILQNVRLQPSTSQTLAFRMSNFVLQPPPNFILPTPKLQTSASSVSDFFPAEGRASSPSARWLPRPCMNGRRKGHSHNTRSSCMAVSCLKQAVWMSGNFFPITFFLFLSFICSLPIYSYLIIQHDKRRKAKQYDNLI